METLLRDLSRLTLLSEDCLASPHMGALVLEMTAPLGELAPYQGRATIERGIELAKCRLRKELLSGVNQALVRLPLTGTDPQYQQAHSNVVDLFARRRAQ